MQVQTLSSALRAPPYGLTTRTSHPQSHLLLRLHITQPYGNVRGHLQARTHRPAVPVNLRSGCTRMTRAEQASIVIAFIAPFDMARLDESMKSGGYVDKAAHEFTPPLFQIRRQWTRITARV